MRNLLFALLLYPLLLCGQGVTQLADRNVYRGNPYSFELVLTRADSGLISSAVLYTDKNGRTLVAASQPVLSRNGRTLSISWSRSQTSTLPDRAFMEISSGDQIRFQAWVNTSKNAIATTAPGSLTVVSTVPDVSAGPIYLPGSTSKTYPLQNVLYSGYTITHNKGTKLVTATFFREDTGQADPLWRIDITTENAIIVRGPPDESFSGRLVLSFTPIVSN